MLAIALITPYGSLQIRGGVETFNEYLSKVFPNISIIDYNLSENNSYLSNIPLPYMEEPKRAMICAKYFLKLHKKNKFDVVFVNGMFGWYLALRKPNIPVVNVFHGNYAGLADHASPDRGLGYFVTKYINGTFERLSGQNKEVITVSRFVKEQIKRYYGIDSVVIHNGIDIERFRPIPKEEARVELNLPEESPIGIFVGRPEYAKGFDILLKAAEMNRDIVFLCVTDLEIKSLRKNVIIRSSVPNVEMYKYYSASDFLIFPSRFEGCSYVPLEAMACNLPIIASNTGLFYEIDSSDLGYVISSYDPLDYLKAIENILSSEKNIKSRQFIKKNFSFKIFSKNYREFVKNLLKNHEGNGR